MLEGAVSETHVWVFNGGGTFPAGVFSTRERAEAWIRQHQLEGTLTAYPLDEGVWDWAVSRGYFDVKRDDQRTARFIARFTSSAQEHVHFAHETQEGCANGD
jgi:hypothetical protein